MKFDLFRPGYKLAFSKPGKYSAFNFLKNSSKKRDDKFSTESAATCSSAEDDSKINSSGPLLE